MATLTLFVFGAAIGSFLNVISLRYDPDKFLLGRQILGRSHSTCCGKKLAWYELIPIFSFIVQRGRCRACGERISFQYPIVEILSGLIFVFVPLTLASPFFNSTFYFLLSTFWILVFSALLLITLIDLRWRIIPDEANIFLAVLGVGLAPLKADFWGPDSSFVGPYALIFGLRENIWLNHFAGALAGAAIFGFLILITRGRGMGMGDLKLAVPLGLIFGWPDIVFVAAFSFIIGSIVGVFLMVWSALVRTSRHSEPFSWAQGKLREGIPQRLPHRFAPRNDAPPADRYITMKSAIPFGPFLALGAATVFFWGEEILRFYFGLFPI